MVFETIVAASIYSSAIAYLHYDGPPRNQASLESKPTFEVTVTGSRGSQDNRAHSAQQRDVDPADVKGKSIWAMDDGNFDDWAK